MKFPMDSNKKILSKDIDMLLLEDRGYDLNYLSIVFPYSFASKLVELNWHDILFAIDHGFLHHQSAVDHAVAEMELNETYPQEVFDLVCLFPHETIYPHSVQPYVSKLANDVPEQEKNLSKDKMLYLVLKWIYEHKHHFEDPITIIEIIYADFDHPKTMSNLTRYMPSTRPDLGTIEERTIKMIVTNWADFLEEQHALFSKKHA